MYAMTCTHHGVLCFKHGSPYQGNPCRANWIVVKSILKYLGRKKHMILFFGVSDTLRVNGYSDDSFLIDRDNLRSKSGCLFTLNGGIVTWKSSNKAQWLILRAN